MTAFLRWALVAFWLLSSGARAQDDEAEYQKLIHSAITEMDRGDYMEALGLFRRAHALHPSARTLRGIGMAQFEVRDYVGAMRALSLALDDPRSPLTEDLRLEASTLIAQAGTFVARVRLALEPAHASVRVDGLEGVRDGPVLLVNPGSHTIEASAPGYQTVTLQLSAQAGQQDELVLALPRASALPLLSPVLTGPAHTLQAEGPSPAPPAREPSRWAERPVAVWFYLGAAAFAGGAVETGVWWAHLSRDLEECEPGCLARNELRDRRAIAQALTFSFAALSASSLTMGIVWQRRLRPQLACNPLESGLACSGQVRY